MLNQFPVSARLPAADMERARTWYGEKLGLEPAGETMGNLWYEVGGTWFLLYKTSYAGTALSTAAGWQVTGIEQVMASLREHGVAFENYDLGTTGKTVDGLLTYSAGKAAWFKDCEGNTIQLSEPLTIIAHGS